MKQNRNIKKTSAVVSVVCAIALIISGTFAWSKIQNIQNEFEETVTPSAELRDDFDLDSGNKDVYVENTGEVSFFVRMKLNEYMEIFNATSNKFESIKDANYKATENPEGTVPLKKIAKEQWDTHICDVNGVDSCGNPTAASKTFHEYYRWKMGGTKKTTLTGKIETYTTPTAAVMTMAEWENAGSLSGDIWVLDTDGYIYYAMKVKPQTTTGLLLDAVNNLNTPDSNFYYAIDAIMEVVLEDDLETMMNGGGPTAQGHTLEKSTPEGVNLLKSISSYYTKITTDMDNTPSPAKVYDLDKDGYLDNKELKEYNQANSI